MTLAKKEPRDYAFLKLMASTELRISDIVRLLREQRIHVSYLVSVAKLPFSLSPEGAKQNHCKIRPFAPAGHARQANRNCYKR
jgi:hypothetical protein